MLIARTNLCFSPINTYFKWSGASNKEYEKKGGQNRSAYNWICTNIRANPEMNKVQKVYMGNQGAQVAPFLTKCMDGYFLI